jgi:hypothetical protein
VCVRLSLLPGAAPHQTPDSGAHAAGRSLGKAGILHRAMLQIETLRTVYEAVSRGAAFEEVAVVPGEFLESGDRILVSLVMQLRPSDSSAKVEMQITHVWTMRDGNPARCEVFLRREQALAAVGLSE